MSKNTAVSKKVNESLKDMFNSWNACANKISGDKAIYELKDPTFPEYRKVCMFVDGHHMLIYGDYGSYVFDDMTWIANPGNLPYDNIGYLMSKMSKDSKESVMAYDESRCEEDILNWLKDRLEVRFELSDEQIKKIIGFVSNGDDYVEEFIEDNEDLTDTQDIIEFSIELIKHTDEFEWIHHLRDVYYDLDSFDEACESSLWHAGKDVCANFYASLFACQVMAEKLSIL